MMRNTVTRVIFAIILIFTLTSYAFAAYVSLDPDRYSGTKIPDDTGAFMRCYGSNLAGLINPDGYFLDYNQRQNFLANTTYSSLPNPTYITPSTGSYVYSWTHPEPWYTDYGQCSMHVLFGSYDSTQSDLGRFVYQPTNYVSIDFLWASLSSAASADLKVYGINDSLLGSYHYTKSDSPSHMSIFQEGIYRVSIVPGGGEWDRYRHGFDNLSFTQTNSGTIFNLNSNDNPDIMAPSGMTLGSSDSLTGTGTIIGSLSNNGGVVSPGHSPGTITIDGDFTQDANGRIVMEISGDDNDKLDISGQADFNGVLEILLDAFDCVEDEVITLMTYGSFTGQFSEVIGLDSASCGFDLSYGENALTLRAKSPVPLPAAAWFMISGLISLFGLRKKFHKN